MTNSILNLKGPVKIRSMTEEFGRMRQIDLETCEADTKATMTTLKPILDKVDFDGRIPGSKNIRKQYADTYKLLVAHQVSHLLRRGQPGLEAMMRTAVSTGFFDEATLTGLGGVVAFGRQILATITRAFPRLITPQLFPVRPMDSSEARIYWENITYNTAFASSSPNISVGDRIDNLSKFNTDYPNKGQLGDANELQADFSNYVVVSSTMKRLSATHSIEAEQDLEDFNGTDLASTLRNRMEFFLKWVIDRTMIAQALTWVPAGNVVTWDAQPTINSVTWANQLPSEKKAYNSTLWSEAFNAAISLIMTNRYVAPNWVIGGPKACEALTRVGSFVPIHDGMDINIQGTSVHDFGTLDGGQMRVLRDPQMTTNVFLLGYNPEMPTEPALRYCPHKPISFFNQLTYPRQAKMENGAYTRFGVGQPDMSQNGASGILAEVYAKITVSNYY